MGVRSNVNIITEHRETQASEFAGPGVEYVGLNIYNYLGGAAVLHDALNAVMELGGGCSIKASYFASFVAYRVTMVGGNKVVDLVETAFTPFVCDTPEEAYSYILENEHLVLAFDLVRDVIVLSDWDQGKAMVVSEFPLTFDGVRDCRQALKDAGEG